MAISADLPLRFIGEKVSIRWVLDNSTAYTIYKGEAALLNDSKDTSYPIARHVEDTVAADICVGIAAEQCEVATGDLETDNMIEIYTWPTIVGFKSTVFDLGDLEDVVYQDDEGDLSKTEDNNAELGTVFDVRDGYVYVKLLTPVICAGADG